jgi:sugar/nucleoside kinase (ribokinase family)
VTSKAVRKLVANPEILIVLKRGAQGCSIHRGSQRIDFQGFQVDEIDPTGAGDCFSVAFIAGLEAGWPLEQVGLFANVAGSPAVTKLGPMEGAHTMQQVQSAASK